MKILAAVLAVATSTGIAAAVLAPAAQPSPAPRIAFAAAAVPSPSRGLHPVDDGAFGGAGDRVYDGGPCAFVSANDAELGAALAWGKATGNARLANPGGVPINTGATAAAFELLNWSHNQAGNLANPHPFVVYCQAQGLTFRVRE